MIVTVRGKETSLERNVKDTVKASVNLSEPKPLRHGKLGYIADFRLGWRRREAVARNALWDTGNVEWDGSLPGSDLTDAGRPDTRTV